MNSDEGGIGRYEKGKRVCLNGEKITRGEAEEEEEDSK
jgi:hypothetical protein